MDSYQRLRVTNQFCVPAAKSSIATIATPDAVQVTAVSLKSPAEKAGFEQGFRITGIEVPAKRPAKEWMYIPGLMLAGLVMLLQRRRAPTPVVPRLVVE